MKYYRKW